MDASLLAGFSIFADASPEELETIAGTCRVEEHRAGDEIFVQDTEAGHLYGVLDGRVDLVLVFTENITTTRIDYEDALSVHHEVLEKPVVVESLAAGDVFGWSSMVAPAGRWTATARCAAPTRVFSVPATTLKRLFETDPRLGYRFMSRLGGVIAQRLQHRTAKLADVWGEAFGGDLV